MDAAELADALMDLIEAADTHDSRELGFEGVYVETYRDGGLLTQNEGLVVSFADGAEFQVTIVQSKQAR